MSESMSIIYSSETGAKIYFARGKFDSWCVFLERPAAKAYAPLDTEYFTFFKQLAKAYSPTEVYESFQKIYALTSAVLNPTVAKVIRAESLKYGFAASDAEIWLAVIYGGMVAEENKANAILKKRIKHLGLHQVLFQKLTVNEAASWSRGRKWREIDAECKRFGF
jgi:hypothetical protein